MNADRDGLSSIGSREAPLARYVESGERQQVERDSKWRVCSNRDDRRQVAVICQLPPPARADDDSCLRRRRVDVGSRRRRLIAAALREQESLYRSANVEESPAASGDGPMSRVDVGSTMSTVDRRARLLVS